MSTIGIIQPNYIPWRGYFDFIREVDVFVFLDDVQFTRRDWRTRNRLKLVDGGTRWLTVPVKGGRDQLIRDVLLDNTQNWARKHWEALRHNYGKAPFFGDYADTLKALYEPGRFDRLVDLDIAFTEQLCSWLGLEPNFVTSSEIGVTGVKADRLLGLVQRLGGDVYLSGPAANDYMRPELWSDAGIEIRYKDYSGYPEYPQVSTPFEPAVTVLDLLFMKGTESPDFIWGQHRLGCDDQESG